MLDDLKNFRMFLLFSTDSYDGEHYIGLTRDKAEAYEHYKNNSGYVVLVTTNCYVVLDYEEQWNIYT